MDRNLARHIVRTAFRCGGKLEELLPLLKEHCDDAEYGEYRRAIAMAIFGIQNINQVNALKVIATTTANGIAVVTFIVGKQILWKYCLLMMIAAALGGYLGARYARGMNPQFIRLLVVLIGLGMAAYFFWKQYS